MVGCFACRFKFEVQQLLKLKRKYFIRESNQNFVYAPGSDARNQGFQMELASISEHSHLSTCLSIAPSPLRSAPSRISRRSGRLTIDASETLERTSGKTVSQHI